MEPASIYGKLNDEINWYALKTRHQHEKRIHERLSQKGIETFLPLLEFYSSRKKKCARPLFTCYVFTKICLRDRIPVLQTDGAVSLVSFNRIPAPIPEDQILLLKNILTNNLPVCPSDYYTVGQVVEVIHGPLKGMQGILTQVKNKKRLVLQIHEIKQAISVEVDERCVKVIN